MAKNNYVICVPADMFANGLPLGCEGGIPCCVCHADLVVSEAARAVIKNFPALPICIICEASVTNRSDDIKWLGDSNPAAETVFRNMRDAIRSVNRSRNG
jgi:hypothetical protein